MTMAFIDVVTLCCLCVFAVSQQCAAYRNFAGYGKLKHADPTYESEMEDGNLVAPNASAFIRFAERNSAPIFQSLPSVSRPRATPAEVAQHRNGGNFNQAKSRITTAHAESQINRSQDAAVNAQHHLLEPHPVIFEHSVLHVDQLPSLYDEYRRRRYTNLIEPKSTPGTPGTLYDSTTWEAQPAPNSTRKFITKTYNPKKKLPLKEEIRAFHDIYLRYTDPQHLNFGHVESRPELFGKRFESLNESNRHKGKVIWADATGGYGEHHWDMANGKLR